jgi:thiol-disulfide isomerase/thioredoxin
MTPSFLALAAALLAPPSPPPYPPGADVKTLTTDGSRVGPLDRLRVPDKFTVFDFYADWCAPCHLVDARLREILAERPDVAVRKLDVVDFDSDLASELGPDFETLPYLVVFSPAGKRTEILGFDRRSLDRALTPR